MLRTQLPDAAGRGLQPRPQRFPPKKRSKTGYKSVLADLFEALCVTSVNQLKILLSHSDYAVSARSKKNRDRAKFDYRISIDRPVCKAVFLFYSGETSKRLDRLKSHVSDESITPLIHGNTGRTPDRVNETTDREQVKSFILNFTVIHGLPDPGRDIRIGIGKLRILLPSMMSYNEVHRQYTISIKASGNTPIAYRTFLKIWQEVFPHIKFNDPIRSLCMTCEEFKKRLNQAAATLDEDKEKKQALRQEKRR